MAYLNIALVRYKKINLEPPIISRSEIKINHVDREDDNENTSNISRKIATFFLFDGNFLYSFQLCLKYITPKGKSPIPTTNIITPIPKVFIVTFLFLNISLNYLVTLAKQTKFLIFLTSTSPNND